MPTVPRFDLPKGVPANRPVVPLVIRAMGRALSGTLASLRLRGDDRDRLRLGVNASDQAIIEFGGEDVGLHRDVALSYRGRGALRLSDPTNAEDVLLRVQASTGKVAYTGLIVDGDTNYRLLLTADAAPDIAFGPGNAASDVLIERPAAKTLALKTPSGTDLLLRFGGTVFPASPANGDLFYRTDLHEWCEYDGARWLGQVQTTLYASGNAITTNGNVGYADFLFRDIQLVRWRLRDLTLTTNNGANFWTVTCYDTDSGGSLASAHGSQSCAADGTLAYGAHEIANSDVISLAGHLGVLFTHAKTGAPGALYYFADIQYRPVYT